MSYPKIAENCPDFHANGFGGQVNAAIDAIWTAIAGLGGGTGSQTVDNEVPQATVDPKVFTLVNVPNPPTSLKVYVDGMRLRYPDDFSLSGNEITFVQVPVGNQVADYRY